MEETFEKLEVVARLAVPSTEPVNVPVKPEPTTAPSFLTENLVVEPKTRFNNLLDPEDAESVTTIFIASNSDADEVQTVDKLEIFTFAISISPYKYSLTKNTDVICSCILLEEI
jgi:hypothetical protein